MNMNEIVIKNINRILKEKQTTIYKLEHVSPQSMHKILKNGNPKLKTLEKLANALDVEITEFFKE